MPEEIPEEELRGTFAARNHTLDYLVSAIRKQNTAKSLTSYFITGPRGSGKTTIVLMLCLRLKEDDELRAHWLPVRFSEELPAVTSLRDLLVAALQILADESVVGAQEHFDSAETEPDDQKSMDLALGGLRQIAGREGKRLILLVENLDRVFEHSFDSTTRSSFRRLLMVDPFMMVIGTAVHTFPELRTYDEAFFNYFCPVPLERLNDDQVRELLFRRANFENDPSVRAGYERNKAKIKAITRLTGGNPRLIVMLHDVLARGDIQSVVATLRELIDELTPLLKDVIENQLPPQQSKVLDAIMRKGGTSTPTEIADRTRLNLNNVTTQLGRLKEAQIVEVRGGGKGRTAYYTVPDQLFCTWYQMRYLRPHRRRIEMVVEFLRMWFAEDERLRALHAIATESSGARGRDVAMVAEYFGASLVATHHEAMAKELVVSKWLETDNIREAALTLAESATSQETDQAGYEGRLYADLGIWCSEHGDLEHAVTALKTAMDQDQSNIELRLLCGTMLGQMGQHGEALRCFESVVQTEGQAPNTTAKALFNGAVAKGFLGDTQGAITDYTTIIEMKDTPADKIARALFNRGATKEDIGDSQGAIADYTAIIEIKGASPDQIARALLNRGATKADMGDSQGAIADYTAIIEIKDAPADPIARAFFNRGLTKGRMGDSQGAIADYTAIIEMKGAPVDQITKALFNRGFAKGSMGDSQGAIADYTAIVEMKGAPPDQIAHALLNRGATKGSIDHSHDEIADYTAIIEMKGAPVDQITKALFNRGFAKGSMGDSQGEIADYTAIIEIKDAPADQIAHALLNRGATKRSMGDNQGAIADYTTIIEMNDAPVDHIAKALLNRGIAKGGMGDSPGEIADYTTIIETKEMPGEPRARALLYRGVERERSGDFSEAISDWLRAASETEASQEIRVKALELALRVSVRSLDEGKHDHVYEVVTSVLEQLDSDERTEHMMGILNRLASPEMREAWADIWRAMLKDQPDAVTDKLEFLRPVADILETDDLTRLDPLPPEQRTFAEEVLKRFSNDTPVTEKASEMVDE